MDALHARVGVGLICGQWCGCQSLRPAQGTVEWGEAVSWVLNYSTCDVNADFCSQVTTS